MSSVTELSDHAKPGVPGKHAKRVEVLQAVPSSTNQFRRSARALAEPLASAAVALGTTQVPSVALEKKGEHYVHE